MITPDAWTPADALTLEPQGLIAAANITHNLVVSAGPGAGKTEVLAQRADFLLRTGGCRYPRRILALSVKVDAAANLRERVRRRSGPELASRLDSSTFHGFAMRLIHAFRPVLAGAERLDEGFTVGDQRIEGKQIRFEDMVPLARSILEANDMVRRGLAQTYSDVFMDEFQDCTTNQYELLRLAFQGTNTRLIAVGDVKQRIMAWAGALDGVMARFQNDFAAKPLQLFFNHRSLPRLRRVQNAMVKVMHPEAAAPDTDLKGDEGTVEVLAFSNQHEEADALALRIQALIKEGMAPGEIAVLARNQASLYAEALVARLRQLGIPIRDETQLQDLSAEPIAELVCDFLLITAGVTNPGAYTRLMARSVGWLMDDAEVDRANARIERQLRRSRSEFAQGRPADQLSQDFLNSIGLPLLRGLAADYQQAGRLERLVTQILGTLQQLEDETGSLVAAIFAFQGTDAVKLLTIHKSKGLEFDHVIVMAVERESFFGNWRDTLSEFFVAISRARKSLDLTYCDHRGTPSLPHKRWDESRTRYEELLDFVLGTS